MAQKPPLYHHVRRRDIIKFLIIRTISNFLILGMIFGLVFTFGPAAYYEIDYRIQKAFGVEYVLQDDVPVPTDGFGEVLDDIARDPERSNSAIDAIVSGQKRQIILPKNAEFSVVIPKIGANSNIISNVDPSNEDEYLRALTKGVAHAKGTSFPGLGGTTYLFAHSADNFWNVGQYNAVFYLLTKLNNGDEIDIYFQGTRYKYLVYDTQTVDPDQVEFITSTRGQGEEVILQTCYPPGTAWKRTLVFARPAASSN